MKEEKQFQTVDGTVVETLNTVPAEQDVQVRDLRTSGVVENGLQQFTLLNTY